MRSRLLARLDITRVIVRWVERPEPCSGRRFHVSSSNRPGIENSSCMTVEIEHVLTAEDVRELIETAEQAGSVRASELVELVERHEMNELEAEALHRECEQRGIDVVEDKEEQPPPQPIVYETTTDALQLFLREAGRHALLTAAQEVELSKRIERGDLRREAADDPVQPAPRGLDREELPQPGPAVPRSDPGRDPRPDPGRREVRLAARLQVLDLRDLVDPPGGRPGARRQGAHDPHAGPHRRAAPEDEQGRAPALDAARPRADASPRSPRRRACPSSRRAR